MFQYLFNDIIPSSVGPNAINKLKDQFHHIEFDDIHIFSENGLYKIINDKIFKFSINEQQNITKIPFKKTFLIKQNKPFIKNKYPENWISPNHESIYLKTHIFKHSPKSNTELHIVYNDDDINDVFILSNLNENQHSFKEDLEKFYSILI
tara:strand:- start:1287 stop:1736 length:450 start_codon:yes stop_codon:yes gene_type:complete